ncbi:metallophosphoesterase [Vibrio splendidus]|nr:metallophosphoesterase [Vibrio splendidus]MCC4880435.1 metallophosphoesterase [Vibrio splendidus]
MKINYNFEKSEHILTSGKRVLFVGDIHGHYDKLMHELDRKKFDPSNDILYSLGDLIDRGSKPIECLKLINEDWFMALLGNHDLFLLVYLLTGEDPQSYIAKIWHTQRSGGRWYLDLSEKDKEVVRKIAEKLSEAPVAREVVITSERFDKTHFGLVHAEVPNDNWHSVIDDKKRNNHADIITESRSRIKQHVNHPKKPLSNIRNIDYVLCGHSIVNRPKALKNQVYLDTGSYRPDGRITCMSSDEIIENMRKANR